MAAALPRTVTLRARLLLLTTLLVTACVLLTSGVLGYVAWRSLTDRARDEAVLASTLLGGIAGIAEQAPGKIEAMVGEGLVAQAYLVAELVDLAGRDGTPPAELGRRLREVAARTSLDEVWVTDRAGNPVATAYEELDATVGGDDPAIGAVIDKVRANPHFATVPDVVRDNLDRVPMKYAGVRRLDGSGGVVVAGRDYRALDELGRRLGNRDTLDLILAEHGVRGVWMTDEVGRVVAGAALPDAAPDLSLAGRAVRAASPVTALAYDRLDAAAPVLDRDGLPAGAALVSLPTDQFRAALKTLALSALGVTALVLALGFALADLVARRVSRPVGAIARAAREVEARGFRPGSLDKVVARGDELAGLARVFQGMAVQVMNREAELERLVGERTAELVAKNEALQAAHRQMEEELSAAQALQAAILPQLIEPEPTHAVSAYMMPARQMGGDFYDAFRIDEHRYGFAIADVAGKGVPAAFFMAVSRTVLRNYGREGLPPGECLARANGELCRTNPMDLFVTVFYAVLDTRTGLLTYANGGHPDVYLVHAGGKLDRLPRTGGMALGVLEDVPYPERSVQLVPGDTLFLLTDGIPEAMNVDGDLFGDEPVEAALIIARREPLPDVIRGVVAAVHGFVGAAPPSDDITCLALRYAAAAPVTAAPVG